MEQEHGESHEGELCPWDLWERGAELAQRADWERDCYESELRPDPLTFEEQVWACDICGWAVALCPEHAAMARDIAAEQEADMRAGDPP